jgi:hypothetical protein
MTRAVSSIAGLGLGYSLKKHGITVVGIADPEEK